MKIGYEIGRFVMWGSEMAFIDISFDEDLSVYRKNKVVIWGTGQRAIKDIEKLNALDVSIVACCDNNEAKWGERFNGVPILSPAELLDMCRKENVVLQIASVYYKAICEQVESYPFVQIITPSELNIIQKCFELADSYNLRKRVILDAIRDNYDTLKDTIEADNFYIDKLEYQLERIMPELYKKYGLSICVIVKNEGEYIREWIEFHRIVGVEHFYIYDNDSSDHLQEILKEYVEQDIVTYISWPGKAQQMIAYDNAIETYKYESKYIAFIDADEFLSPMMGDSILETLDDIFHTHINVGGVGVNWRVYGTSFHKRKMSGLLLENYKYRADDFLLENAIIKTICDPRRVVSFRGNPHIVSYRGDYHCVSEHGSYIPDEWFYDGMCRRLRLNHFKVKSVEEYAERLRKGKADSNIHFTEDDIARIIVDIDERYNTIYDTYLDKYIPELKERLGMKYKE